MHKPRKQWAIYKGIPFPPWPHDWNSVAKKTWRRRRKKKIDCCTFISNPILLSTHVLIVWSSICSIFGDVESLSIEDPVEIRQPQYALDTFGSLETMLFILGGKEKAKFVVGGKHLWARRYVPRNHEKGKNEAWM